ncbi:acyltransferase family protein [Phocaeicola plebeius]|uniref:acyltransferase family protein n=1 Tax=Phocaeicola plebeius TaxID=310297 RepID=UPI003567F3C5
MGQVYLINLFCVQRYGILWFIYTFIGFYLLVPIISLWIKQASKRELKIYLLLWLIAQCYSYLLLFLEVNSFNLGILFIGYAGYFLLGYYLNRYPVSLKLLLSLPIKQSI